MSEEHVNKEDDFVLDCIRCEHKWPRKILTRLPKVCPNCKSPYWNTPYQNKPKTNHETEPAAVENHA